MKYKYSNKRGFTLLEVLIVIGIIAVLSAAVLVAVNPTRQFKLARDSQRVGNVNTIVNAISQNVSEHRGVFMCKGLEKAIPTIATNISSVDFNLAECLVPDYIASLPYDPSKDGAKFVSVDSYDTKYVLYRNAEGRIVASSTGEIEGSISAVR